MAVGLDRTVQGDFSAGMFQSVARERIPSNGAYDIVNGLLDETGAIYKRGRALQLTASTTPARSTFVWAGTLSTATVVVLTTAARLYVYDEALFGFTDMGAYTGMPVPRRVAVMNGVMYLPGGKTFDGTTLAAVGGTTPVSTLYAVVANRLISANIGGRTIKFSGIGTPGTFAATDLHEIPTGVTITGLQAMRDSLAVFTTGGVYVISNMALNLTDTAGNVQHRVDLFSADLALWADAGIAAWAGNIIVPAKDGVWLMTRGVSSEAPLPFQMISRPIAKRYAGYTSNSGWTAGNAVVYRNHYLLPVVTTSTVADLLVCRLDAVDSRGRQTFPWTRLSGVGARLRGFTTRASASELLGAYNTLAGTGCVATAFYFDPDFSGTEDVMIDPTTSSSEMVIETRDYATGPGNENTVSDVRLDYELTTIDPVDPTIVADVDQTGAWVALSGSAPEAPTDPFRWRVAKRRRYARFRLSTVGQGGIRSAKVKSLDVRVRSAGRV